MTLDVLSSNVIKLVDLFIGQLKTISHSHDLLWPTWWGTIEAWFAKGPWATEFLRVPLS